MPRIEMSKLVEKMDLKNLTPDVDLSGIYLEESRSEPSGITADRLF